MLAERLHPEPIPSLTETPSMVRRRKREPRVLIAAARFLPTMLARFPRRSPRRTHQLLTNVAGRSCAAPLTAPARKSAPSGWAAVQRSGKGCKTFPVSVRDA